MKNIPFPAEDRERIFEWLYTTIWKKDIGDGLVEETHHAGFEDEVKVTRRSNQ